MLLQVLTNWFVQDLKPEASVEDDDDDVLFSDDEQAGFELGSQVERIEHFLLSDRLKVSKTQHKAAGKPWLKVTKTQHKAAVKPWLKVTKTQHKAAVKPMIDSK